MPDTQATTSRDDNAYVEFVLRSALTAPGASTDPTAGRVLARLLAVIAAERGDDVVAPYLAAVPSTSSIFEVRVFRAGDLTPATVTAEAGPGAALRTAMRLAREGDAGVEVISRQTSADLERCVLVRDATGALEFRFPGAETLTGEPDACSDALRAWQSTLDQWADEIGGPRRDGSTAADQPPIDEATNMSESNSVIDALEGFFSNLTIEVDLSQVEQLVRKAVEGDRKEMVEPIAERVAGILDRALTDRALHVPVAPDEPPRLASIVVPVPSANEVAGLVTAQVGALLSETILSRRHGETAGQVTALRSMVGAIQHLEVLLDGLRDEVRRSAALLTSVEERLDVNDRRAALSERVAESVDQQMQRLAHRIDEQVTALAANAGGGSELSDGVARLTRKLRQSVAELDRALVRLDDLLGNAGTAWAPPPPVPIRAAEESEGPRPPGRPLPGTVGPSFRR